MFFHVLRISSNQTQNEQFHTDKCSDTTFHLIVSRNVLRIPGMFSTENFILCPEDSMSKEEFPRLLGISSKFSMALRTPRNVVLLKGCIRKIKN